MNVRTTWFNSGTIARITRTMIYLFMAILLSSCPNTLFDSVRQEVENARAYATVNVVGVGNMRSYNFGNIPYDGSSTVDFTIENNGNIDLKLTGTTDYVTVDDPTYFAIVAQPPSDTVNPGDSVTFRVEFTPLGTGSDRSASIMIPTNDFDYTFTVIGQGVDAGTVVTPLMSPTPGTRTAAVEVSLSSSTPGATILYTTDGSTPTHSNPTATVYNDVTKVDIVATVTLRAFAYLSGWVDSAVASGLYTITGTVATPTFSPTGGDYADASVVIASSTPGATIRYTIDGSTPTSSHGAAISNGASVTIEGKTVLRAMAYKTDWADSGLRTDTFNIVWAKTMGGISADYLYAVAPNGVNGSVAAGFTNSYGSQRAWVLRLDGGGNPVTQRTYSSSGDQLRDIVKTPDGGYIACGQTNIGTATDKRDGLVMKLDSQLNLTWARGIGASTTYDGFNAVTPTSDGGYVAVGFTLGYGGGNADAWIVKFNSSGTVLWQQTLGELEYDCFNAVIERNDGGILAGGSKRGYTDYYADHSMTLGYLVRFAADGSYQQDHIIDALSSTYVAVQDIVEIPGNQGFLVLSRTTLGAGSYDTLFTRIGNTYSEIWHRSIGGTGNDTAYDVIRTTDGGFAVMAYTDSSGQGKRDFWLLKLNADGTSAWQRTYGGVEDDISLSLIQTGDGGFILGGYTQSSSYGAGGYDYWLLKVDSSGLPVTYNPGLSMNLGAATAVTVANVTTTFQCYSPDEIYPVASAGTTTTLSMTVTDTTMVPSQQYP